MAEDYSTSDMKGSVSTADYLVHTLIQKQITLEQFLISTSLTTLKRWLNKASCTRRLDGCRSKPNDTTVTDADEICLKTQEFTASHKTNCGTISTNFLILKFQLTLFGLAKYIVCRIFCTVWIVCLLTTQLRRCCRASTTATPSSSASQRRHWHHCRVLHVAARLVLDLTPLDHVTHALRELHWLPVMQRIEYKLCLLVHKALIGQASDYIANLLTLVTNIPSRSSMRASSNGDLFQPRTERRTGDCAFSVAAPRAWNHPLTELKLMWSSTATFRRHPKSFIICTTYWLCNVPSGWL